MVTFPIWLLIAIFVVVSIIRGKGASARLFGVGCLLLGLYLASTPIGSSVRDAFSGAAQTSAEVSRDVGSAGR